LEIIAQCDPRNRTEAGQDLVAPVREIASDTVAIQHRRDSVGIPAPLTLFERVA
jgi:hypothetical protein